MNHLTETRSGRLTLFAVMLTCGMIAECGAADEESRPVRHVVSKKQSAVDAAATQGKSGPMRYYGGPKSPMWRAPALE